jgi:hypothetical protein
VTAVAAASQPLCPSVARPFVPWNNHAAKRFFLKMEKASERRHHTSHPHLRRWMREILLATLLTVAAATVITVALWRGDGANQGVVPLARKQ